MTKTTNYALPQWEAADAIQRADFNAAMETIDGGLAGALGAARAAQATADGAVTTLGSRFVTGSFRVNSSTATYSTVVSLPAGAKVLVLNPSLGVTTVIPVGTSARMYVADWELYWNFQLNTDGIYLNNRTDTTSNLNIHYAVLY